MLSLLFAIICYWSTRAYCYGNHSHSFIALYIITGFLSAICGIIFLCLLEVRFATKISTQKSILTSKREERQYGKRQLRNIEKKYPMILCKVIRDTLQSNTYYLGKYHVLCLFLISLDTFLIHKLFL